MRLRTLLAAALIGAVAPAVAAATPASAAPVQTAALASDSQYEVKHTLAGGVGAALGDPSGSPPGVNVPCELSAAHPRPVILINGTFANMIDDWSGLGPTLANDGYCVYSAAIGADPNHFIQTIGPVEDSVKQIGALVDRVRADTGAAKVDLVGHSQGGMIAEYYTKFYGRDKVSNVVGLSPSTHGTTLAGIARLAAFFPGAIDLVGSLCPACKDQVYDSALIAHLNDGPIAQPGVSYTVIETHNELVVTPAGDAAFIDEPGVQNLWVQSYCWWDIVDHASLSYDPIAWKLTKNALDPAHAVPVNC